MRNTSCFTGIGFLVAVAFAAMPHAAGLALFVSPAGHDGHPGTREKPLKTLDAARDAARTFVGREPVTITLTDGIHYLPDTFKLGSGDSGTKRHPVIYQAENEGKAVLSGGLRLQLKWQAEPGGRFKATTPAGLVIDQLFIDGKRQHMARYPDFRADQPTAAYQGFSADAFSPERAARWNNPAGAYIHAMHASRWGGYHYRITGKNADGSVAYEGGWQNNRQMGMHPQFRMVENVFEELDVPGEWFHDASQSILYFKPEAGNDPNRSMIEVVRLRHLVEFDGTPRQPVRFVTLRGFTFRHAARTFMDTREPLLRSDWTIYRGGAVRIAGAENVSILDSEFDQVGGNAVFASGYNRRILIKGCHIHDAGASGVCFVGMPGAVRNPLFSYGETQDLAKLDLTPGPKTDDYPADSAVEDCLIHGIGRVERQSAAVQISMAQRISVKDTSVYDCSRAGINVSEGTWGGHLIDGCDVFDTVLETDDHGSFNSWGRDRFWVSNHRGVSEPAVKKNPKLPFLDAMEPTIIRNSRWRCDHGWDIDLDDGSSNYQIYNNLMLAGGLKFREGYRRSATNNILINSGFHPHVWFDDSDSGFSRNIVMKAHAPIGQPGGWATLVDHNFFTSEADRAVHLGSGCDAGSLSGDPEFMDPVAGDFRVRDGSPALKVGFRNFPMNRFGVKKPSLRKIARTPVIPQLGGKPGSADARQADRSADRFWHGARLHTLAGEEFSAFGVRREEGGVQLVEVPEGSAAARAGLRENDLIQGVGSLKVKEADDLLLAMKLAGGGKVKIRYVRDQRPQELSLEMDQRVRVEFATNPEDFSTLKVPVASKHVVTASPATNNDPLAVLTDGALVESYGPVFANGVREGAYKIDLGSVQEVASISGWSFHHSGRRGCQIYTIYGSTSEVDPGWKLDDRSRFTPIASIDTGTDVTGRWVASSLRARKAGGIGEFRWIVWQTAPLNKDGENTAWQEFHVRTAP